MTNSSNESPQAEPSTTATAALEWHNERRKVSDLVPYEKNPRRLSPNQAEQLKKSLDRFGLVEVPVINTDNTIIAGHQRLKILKLIGHEGEEIDVRVPNRPLTTQEFDEYLIRSNKNSGDWDWELLNAFDSDLLLSIGFDVKDIQKILGTQDQKNDARLKLQDRFIVPPFSILDTRQKYWMQRKAAWLALTGALEQTRESTLWKSNTSADVQYYKQKTDIENFLGRKISNEEYEENYYDPNYTNGGTSVFDPVLTEICYTWFNVKGGKILDPFMGGQTRPLVAGELKMPYTGIDIRPEQVEVNKAVCDYPNQQLITGDSNQLNELVKDTDYDLVFTCPPYYDLEVYSKEDMSALGTYEEFMAQYKSIFSQAIAKLKDDRFVVLVVGEVRNKKTGVYRNFVGDNVTLFKELGLNYYNEMILINHFGNLPVRAPKQFNQSRKIGKCHQNVIAFYKGDAKRLFKETKALQATHQNVYAFYKGDPKKIEEVFGIVAPESEFMR